MIVKILIIDDHSVIVDAYKGILSQNAQNLPLAFTTAFTLESAYNIITDTLNQSDFDLVLLDRSLPLPFKEKDIYSGEDLVPLIKIHIPKAKIMVLTNHLEPFVLHNIIKKIAPAGLLVKSDFDREELLVAFDKILGGEIYHSATVKKTIALFLEKEMHLDAIDRQILVCIANGIKNKDMHLHLNLRLSAIEKRKARIKIYFGIENGTNEDVIKAAKEVGFL